MHDPDALRLTIRWDHQQLPRTTMEGLVEAMVLSYRAWRPESNSRLRTPLCVGESHFPGARAVAPRDGEAPDLSRLAGGIPLGASAGPARLRRRATEKPPPGRSAAREHESVRAAPVSASIRPSGPILRSPVIRVPIGPARQSPDAQIGCILARTCDGLAVSVERTRPPGAMAPASLTRGHRRVLADDTAELSRSPPHSL